MLSQTPINKLKSKDFRKVRWYGLAAYPSPVNPSPSAKADVKGGSGGKVPKAPAPPRGCTAKIHFWPRGPSRPPVPHEAEG